MSFDFDVSVDVDDNEFANGTTNTLVEHPLPLGEITRDLEFTSSSTNGLSKNSISLDKSIHDLEFTSGSNNGLSENSISLDKSIHDLEFTSGSNNDLDECLLSLDKSISYFDVELKNTLNHRDLKEYDMKNSIGSPSVWETERKIVLSDTALLCAKLLILPIALFSHVTRFALSSINTAFSFAVAFFISDIMFFYILDKFSLSYVRYILLGVTGIVALSSMKEIVISSVDLFLSFFKGVHSWYFNLINPNCSFSDFLLGKNTITNKN